MKKNILFVIDSLSSGGAEKSLVSLLTLFDYSKYSVDLLMFSQKGLYLPLLPEQVNILEVPKYLQEQSKSIKYLINNGKLKELYLRGRTSLDIRNPYLNNKLHGAQITWKWTSKGIENIEKIYDVAIAYSQGMPTYYVAEKVKSKKKLCWINIDYKVAKYNKNYDIEYYNQFNNIVAVSDSCKDVLVNELPNLKSKVKVIYDIISPTLIKEMAEENGGYDDGYDGMRILTIGRLVYQKGYEYAIEACYKLKQSGLDFKWYAIGEGDLEEKLRQMVKELDIEDRFIFIGTHKNPYKYLKQSDIYVQPSRFEGFGLAIAEARLLQKPIVATNFTIVHNQIINEKNGLIVNMNSDDLYKGIKRIIQDKKLRENICINLSKEDVGTEKEINKVYSLIEEK